MPHGVCFNWDIGLLSLHVFSDIVIAIAYFSIPIGIVYFVRQRKEQQLSAYYYLFAAFITACGITHIFGIVNLWHPVYLASGIAKLITALVSFATAVYLLPRLPTLLSLPNLTELSTINKQLSEENEERKRFENQLYQKQKELDDANAKLKSIIESMPTGLFWTNQQGALAGFNPAYQALFGDDHILSEAGNKSPYTPPFLNKGLMSSIHQHISNDTNHKSRFERTIQSENGKRYFDATIVAIKNDSNSSSGALALVDDVTERKNLEFSIRQAVNDAKRANAVKTQFLARVSHELRTPLNSILGFTQLLLLKNKFEGKVENYIKKIESSGRYLLELVDDMLDLAKIESTGVTIDSELLDPTITIEESVDMFKTQARENGVTLHVNAPQTEVKVNADKRRLKEIINNLISNAIKYKGDNDPYVLITLNAQDGMLVVEVEDNGQGIDLENSGDPFELFNRAGHENSSKIEGSGIGLAVCKRFVEAMGGMISLNSTEGTGTKVEVRLPLENPNDGSITRD
jgi:PAS domain S-box-containing protein